jgi:hypothetical protein
MMAALIDAADRAAAACDQVQTIFVGLRGNGFVVMGRIETPLLGYTHELTVPYATAELEPTALPFAVERMERALEKRRSEIPTFMIDSAEQPPVRVIERSDWSFWDQAVRAVAVLALIVCLPLASGIWP